MCIRDSFNRTGGAQFAGPTNVVVTIADNELGPGTVDNAFEPGTGANDLVRAVAVQTNGAAVIGGAFTNVDGSTHRFVARLDASGDVDTNFNAAANALVTAVAVQGNGRIPLGGAFSQLNAVTRNRVGQLLADG